MSRRNAFVVIYAIPTLLALLFLLKKKILSVTEYMPECEFYKITGLMCPSCGNTRSIKCLLRGELVKSMQYNMTPICLLLWLGIFYVNCVHYVIYDKWITFPYYKLFVTNVVLVIIYYVTRNLI